MRSSWARADGIELTEVHWVVLNILRDYYNEFQAAPAVRVLNKTIGKKVGKDKGNSKRNISASSRPRRLGREEGVGGGHSDATLWAAGSSYCLATSDW